MEKIVDNRVDVRILLKPFHRRGAIHDDDPACAGVDRRLNARGRILDDDAFPGREPQPMRRLDVKCRVGLAGQRAIVVDDALQREPALQSQILQIKLYIPNGRSRGQREGNAAFRQADPSARR